MASTKAIRAIEFWIFSIKILINFKKRLLFGKTIKIGAGAGASAKPGIKASKLGARG